MNEGIECPNSKKTNKKNLNYIHKDLNKNDHLKNNILSIKTKCDYTFIYIINFLLLFFLFNFSSEVTNNITLYFDSSSSNTINILNNEFEPLPNKTEMNGIVSLYDKNSFTLSGDTIKLIWEIELNNCSSMFYSSAAKKIDLSEFNSGNVVDMKNMFSQCLKLEEIIFGNLNTSNVVNMESMFAQSTKITYLDLSNFDASKVISMNSMFLNCVGLTFINLTNIKTSSLKDMTKMFQSCIALTSLDLSYFDTSKVTNFFDLFNGCNAIKNINFNNFNTIFVANINSMFYSCNKLLYLDLSSFDLSNVINAGQIFYNCYDLKEIKFNQLKKMSRVNDTSKMFQNCKNLTSIDLSFLDTSNVKNMNYMFSGCEKLRYLNFPNLNISSLLNADNFFNNKVSQLKYFNAYSLDNNIGNTKMDNSFSYLPNDIEFCIHEKAEILINILENKDGINDCETVCNIFNQKRTPYDTSKCYSSCIHDEIYQYEYNNLCYIQCPIYTKSFNKNKVCELYEENDSTNINLSKEENEEEQKEEYNEEEKNEKESEDFTERKEVNEIEENTMGEIKKETNEKEVGGEETEEEVKTDIIKEEKEEDKDNENLSDINKKLLSSMLSPISSKMNNELSENIENESKLSENIPKSSSLNQENNSEKIEFNNDILINENCDIFNFLNNLCEINENTIDINANIINKIRNNIKANNIKEILEKIIGAEKKDYIIELNKTKHQLTSTYNQENKNYINISTINLGECEEKLKSENNISINESLIIYKIDIYEEGLLMPVIEYEVYNPISYEKLNLDICKNKIQISYPVSINENELYKYNMSSNYYNDKCFPTSYDNDVDIILKDRQNEYIKNNYSLCENNCDLIGYNKNTKKAICDCEIKDEINLVMGYKIDKNRILKNFKDIKNLVNLYVLKCYKILFKKEGLIKNIGSYIIIFSTLFYLFSTFIFANKGFEDLKLQIDKIKKINNFEINKIELEPKKEKTITKNKASKKKKKKSRFSSVFEPIKRKSKSKAGDNKKNISNNEINGHRFSSSKACIYKKQETKNEIYDQLVNLYLNDYELNNLSYSDAVKHDTRNYFQYYLSLLKTKHLIVFTFCYNNDYNSFIIKLCLFLFSFILYYTINASFYTENTIHNIYEKAGAFDFLYHIPQIIYSTVISIVFNTLIKFLSLSQKDIIKIKSEKKILDDNKINSCLKCLKIKFVLFFVFSFIFLLAFWYYLGCFCAVYHNTQIYIIIDTLISFSLSLIYPLFINLIPGFIRIPSLKDEGREKKYMYTISRIIQII